MKITDILTSVGLIVGFVTGCVGIYILLRKDKDHRLVGTFLSPFAPATLFFGIPFSQSSNAAVQVIGTFGGPIAAYIGILMLLRRFIIKDSADEKQIETLNDKISELQNKLNAAGSVREDALSFKISREYHLKNDPDRKILIQDGNISQVRPEDKIDVIVNSENTDMSIARFYDRSLSGTLRYLDAGKDSANRVIPKEDNLYNRLNEQIKSQKVKIPVSAGTVLVTKTTKLQDLGVKYVFHAAAVQGYPASGYRPIKEALDNCVQNCFTRFQETKKITADIESLLFPLFGAGDAKLPVQEAADKIIPEIIRNMARTVDVKRVYILAFTQSDWNAIYKVLEQLKKDKEII